MSSTPRSSVAASVKQLGITLLRGLAIRLTLLSIDAKEALQLAAQAALLGALALTCWILVAELLLGLLLYACWPQHLLAGMVAALLVLGLAGAYIVQLINYKLQAIGQAFLTTQAELKKDFAAVQTPNPPAE